MKQKLDDLLKYLGDELSIYPENKNFNRYPVVDFFVWSPCDEKELRLSLIIDDDDGDLIDVEAFFFGLCGNGELNIRLTNDLSSKTICRIVYAALREFFDDEALNRENEIS